MEFVKSSRAIAVVTTALFIVSLFWLMNTKRVNASLETGLQDEKLKSEELLSEKLLLEKEIQKFRDQLAGLKSENTDLDRLAKATSAKLATYEAEYNKMKKENAGLAQLKKQRQELMALQHQLENELQSLRISYANLEAKNRELNSAVASLEERNKILTDDLNRAMFASIDQSQIQAVKKNNEKLTIRARRTKKLLASFEVPANLKNLSFRVIDHKGTAMTEKNGTISSVITPAEGTYTASNDMDTMGNRLQKVDIAYNAKEKLKPGIYAVEILNDNLYVGSLKVKLK